ncbi:hypothetical protein AAG570_005581 [Ranatra chinensis]|uniref:C2 domain-containing protein n=1 Tax=Ranatra chinensis TaxID=642074 RepID=A0ABD0XXY3_9HEMI
MCRQVFKVAKEAEAVQPSCFGRESGGAAVAPPLQLTGAALQPTLCRTPSLSSQTSIETNTSTKQRAESRSLSRDSTSGATSRQRPLSPLLVPQHSTTSLVIISSCRDVPSSPLPVGTLQPDLYTKPEGPLIIQSHNNAGRFHLTVAYDFDRSDLHVHLIEGEDIVDAFSEPYVRLSLEPPVDSRMRQTNTQPQPNPVFDQHFKFPVSFEDLNDKDLVLQVFDYDRYSRNDIIGELRVSLCELDVTSRVEIWGDIAKTKKPPEELQEVLISLSYLPSAERLTVVLLKARNLFTPENRDTVDPFVKVYLLSNGKRIKKKKTACRKASPNPVWNEALTFNINSNNLQNSAVEICVLDQGSDLIGGPSILGCALIGGGSSHWAEMISSPRKAVAMWHVLR